MSAVIHSVDNTPRTGADSRPWLVVGLGATGVACVRHLVQRGETVEVVDTRANPPGLAALRAMQPEPVFRSGELDTLLGDRAATAYQALVVSPGLPLDLPAIARARAAGVAVLGELDLFGRALADSVNGAAVAAITGTNGKSTVTSLVGTMLCEAGWPAAAGGNLGPPALELLDADPLPRRFALELSSFQLERSASLRPRVAALLNLSPDHLDHHRSMAEYAAAKARVFAGARIAVVNLDQPEVVALAREAAPGASLRGFTLSSSWRSMESAAASALTYSLRDGYLYRASERVAPRSDFSLAGSHNAANALAALAIADALGVPQAAALRALRQFRGLPHRSEPVGTYGGVLWLNDSKGTNVGASLAALEGVGAERPVVLMLGGDGKGQDFVPLAEPVQRLARGVVLFGRDRDRIAAALQADGGKVRVRRVDSLGPAVAAAAELAQPGDAVLLSPACASFDQFPNYLARGVAFADEVRSRFA